MGRFGIFRILLNISQSSLSILKNKTRARRSKNLERMLESETDLKFSHIHPYFLVQTNSHIFAYGSRPHFAYVFRIGHRYWQNTVWMGGDLFKERVTVIQLQLKFNCGKMVKLGKKNEIRLQWMNGNNLLQNWVHLKIVWVGTLNLLV